MIGNSYTFALAIGGYYFWGLTGIGFTYMLSYLIYMIQVFILTKIKYGFSFTSSFSKIFAVQLGLALICSLLTNITKEPFSYIAGVILLAASTWYSYRTLNNFINIRELIQDFKIKIRKKKGL